MANVSKPFKVAGSNYWYLKWRAIDPATGEIRQILRSTRTQDKKIANAARRAIEDKLAKSQFGLADDEKDMTPEDAWEYFSGHSPDLSDIRRYQIKAHWRCFFRDIKRATVASVTTADILLWQGEMKKAEKRPSYTNKISRDCRQVYEKLIKLNQVSGANPFAGVDPLKNGKQKPKLYAKWDIVECLLAAAWAKSQNIYLFCVLCSHLGLRRSEAVMARWEHIDWVRGTFHVHGTKTAASDAVLPLHPALQIILIQYRQDGGYIVAPERTNVNALYPWARWKGLQQEWSDVANACNFVRADGERGTIHTLRHSYSTRLRSLRYSLSEVQKATRHEKLDMTLHYADEAEMELHIPLF